MTDGDHYFTAAPASDADLRPLETRLAGRDVTVTVANGVFSAERLDAGTRVLLEAVPAPPEAGDLLDLGCGWGPIALTLALRSPAATVWAVDVNERSLELTRRNAAALGLDNVRVCGPDEVPAGLRFQSVWSNPPIRIGKQALHELLERWLDRVVPGGDAWLVVSRDLGADSLHRWLGDRFEAWTVTREATDHRYRVLCALND